MNRQYLDPKQPLGIEPDADRNVERMTDCCLDVRPKSSYLFGRGRGGGAWWMIWMIFFVVVLCALGLVYLFYKAQLDLSSQIFLNGLFEAIYFVIIPSVIFFGLSLLWPIHIWKTHLPLRFNRKTRKVYFHWKGKTYVEDWHEIKVSLKAQFGMNAMGAPIRDPHVNVEFHNENGSTFTVFLMGVERMGFTPEHRAAAFWEYIRRYMEKGPDELPEPDLGAWRPLDLKGLYLDNMPFPVFKSQNKCLWPLEITLLFPLRFIWFSISYPTELIYYFVEKHVKVNPFPPEMEEACRCDQAVKVWYPKQATEEAA
jgi:hypothetical protein